METNNPQDETNPDPEPKPEGKPPAEENTVENEKQSKDYAALREDSG